jgi:hypothetical protein
VVVSAQGKTTGTEGDGDGDKTPPSEAVRQTSISVTAVAVAVAVSFSEVVLPWALRVKSWTTSISEHMDSCGS